MKKITFFLIVLNFCFCNAQIKNGSILYGKLNATMDLKNFPIELKEQIIKSNKDSDKIEYILNFMGNESYFYANPILFDDNSKFATYVTLGNGKLKYYQNDKTKVFREYKDSKRTGITIVNKKENYEWTLINETKIIDGRKCYKATSPQISSDGIKSTDPKFNIIGWYTPEIPVKIGPLGFGGLPGLILELQKTNVTYFVKKINLNLDKDPKIDRLTDLKAISQEELFEMTKKTLTKEQLEGIEEVNERKNKI